MKIEMMKIHRMLNESKQYQITFKAKNGTIISMASGLNKLTGDWMYWFSVGHAMYYTNKRGIKTIIKNIRKETEVYFDNFLID